MDIHVHVPLSVPAHVQAHGARCTSYSFHVSATAPAHVQAHEHARELGARAETLCVAGDSAGGNLSGVTAMMARDKGTPPVAFQLMVSPVRDFLPLEGHIVHNLTIETDPG